MAKKGGRKISPIYIVLMCSLALVLITVIVTLLLGYRYTSDEHGIKFLGKTSGGVPMTGSLNYPGEVDGTLDRPNNTITFDNGDKYVGDISGLCRHGYGTMTYANGDRYEGQWVDDKMSGTGTFYYANGDCYEGQFENGVPNGEGVATLANGDRYEGGFKDGLKHGQGKATLADGTTYEGEYANDARNGEGTLVLKLSDGTQEIYTGRWVNDLREDTEADITYSNGEKYHGPFINDLPDTRARDEDGNFITDEDGNYVHTEKALYTKEDGTKTYLGYFEEGKIVTYKGEDYNG